MRLWSLLCLAPFAAYAQTLTVDGSNSPYTVSTAATFMTVTVNAGGVLIVNAPLTVTGDMLISAGGEVTVDQTVKRLRLTVTGTLTVEFGGSIHADAKGLLGSPAAGYAEYGETIDPVTFAFVPGSGRGTGGTHASRGESSQYAPSALVYGQAVLAYPGGGGGAFVGGVAGNGGGVVSLNAGTLILNGQLRANGGNGPSGGGGAGGTVSVTATVWQGGGEVSASGGNEQATGSGGAGRIIGRFTTFSFGGTFKAFYRGAPAGSIWLLDSSNRFRVASSTGFSGGESFSELIFLPGSTLDVQGRVTIQTPVVVPLNSRLTISVPAALDAMPVSRVDGQLVVTANVSSSADLTVSGLLILNGELRVPNLTLIGTGAIVPSAGFYGMNLVVAGALSMGDNARIDAIGLGLPGGFAPGSQFGVFGSTISPSTGLVVQGSSTRCGGSHGGAGGKASGQTVAPLFDSPSAPKYPGGGGAGAIDGVGVAHLGGAGGGVMHISAATSVIDGLITVDGATGDTSEQAGPAGSGAGGSLILSLGAATGHGSISARGGSAGAFGAGAGGGLIHLTASSVASTLTLSVAGGTGAVAGDPGVITQQLSTGAAPKIVSVAPMTVKAGQMLSYSATATGTAPLTWSLTAAPAGATVSSTGLVTWPATGVDSQLFTLKVDNGVGSDTQTFALQVLAAPVITSTARTATQVGVPYFYDDDATASATGSAPFTWSILAAPAGFTLDSVTGAIGWTPTSLGTSAACIKVSNSVGEAQQCFSILVTTLVVAQPDAGISVTDGGTLAVPPAFTSAASTTAFCGAPYHYSGLHTPEVTGSAPFVFTIAPIAGSALPAGLIVDAATGELTWTPAKADIGTHPLSFSVTNSAGRDTQVFSIVVECKDETKIAVGCSTSGSAGLGAWALGLLLLLCSRRQPVAAGTQR